MNLAMNFAALDNQFQFLRQNRYLKHPTPFEPPELRKVIVKFTACMPERSRHFCSRPPSSDGYRSGYHGRLIPVTK